MAALNRLRIVLWGVVAVAAIAATGLYAYTTTRPGPSQGLGQGDYVLETAEGAPFSRADLVGQPSLLFFGFTHCPDVCPTTLAEIASWYETLGAEAGELKSWFVSVDPERDTPAVIGDYVAWTGHVTGVTGTPAEVDKAARAWAVYYAKVPTEDGDYTMDHTASVFLVGKDGNFEGAISYGENNDTALAKIRKLLAG